MMSPLVWPQLSDFYLFKDGINFDSNSKISQIPSGYDEIVEEKTYILKI